MNEGRVRVLIGSTGKMSVGMNVQQRLIAQHNLDCPWRPGDLEQRHGRILRQGNCWPECYIFTYITEGSFDGYLFQLIESKARFIAQALAGEITARTAEDTSEVVLSAAEIKAIASGNPQVVRKVQLEAEVARMERVRAVWLATRQSLTRERHLADTDLARLAARRAQWAEAAAIVATHPHEPFVAQVQRTLTKPARQSFTERAEAGAAIRARLTEAQQTASRTRQRQTHLIGHYRGLHLVVIAHPVFDPDLHLCLPDGTRLETVNATTDSGIWQSIGHTISRIPERLQQADERRAEIEARCVALEHEQARLATWDGETAYHQASRELSEISAAFAAAAAAEANEAAGHAHADDATTGPATERTTAATSPQADGLTLAEELLALARAEQAAAHWTTWQAIIPPAPTAMAWMASDVAEHKALPASVPAHPAEAAAEPHTDSRQPVSSPPQRNRPPARQRQPAPTPTTEPIWQLPLF